MLEDFYDRILPIVRVSQFAPDLDTLGAHLRHRGHRHEALAGYMYGAAHLAACLERGLIRLEKGLTADRLQEFARQHVARCSCPRPRSKGSNFVSVARHFFDVLNARHCLTAARPPVTIETTPVEILLRELDEHLRDVRGLRPASRERCTRELRRLLHDWCGTGPVDVCRWTVRQIRECLAGRTRWSSSSARARASALRGLLRFLALRGERVGHLALAVPVVRSVSRLGGLPRGLSDEQLEDVVGSIDVSKPIGLRARAIVECLVGLGLRAGEVAALRLDDIDWRAGTLLVGTSKVRRGHVMPLQHRIGRAVAAYLKRGRPATTDDHVFVRHYMPRGGALDSADVTQTVTRAFRRAGLSLPAMGAHVLRHTTASRLVRAGVSFKQVADLMRHRDIDTTMIYTKVDWPRLAEVALPWPTVVAS
jgi:site-specific recombinase XerD